jgi:hypothetical protein
MTLEVSDFMSKEDIKIVDKHRFSSPWEIPFIGQHQGLMFS